jgi:secondary thiamine-phosphate synthase enzyme
LPAQARLHSARSELQEATRAKARRDLEAWLERAVVDGDPLFDHTAEGPDGMSAHVRSALLSIPIQSGRLALGTWQGLFLYEHRMRPHQRRVLVLLQAS